MITVKGKYNVALCFTDELEQTAREQIKSMTDDASFAGAKIRIMPDVHAGASCTIGTTMTIGEKVSPSLVGMDIGCGMYAVSLGNAEVDLKAFDAAAHELPSGRRLWKQAPEPFDFTRLVCYPEIKHASRATQSLGTLGGGNHFIELDRDEEGELYLVIHSGSRYLGAEVATHYVDVAVDQTAGVERYLAERQEIIAGLKGEGREKEVSAALKKAEAKWKTKRNSISREKCCLSGQALKDYLHDIKITAEFARVSREIMARYLLNRVGLHPLDAFHTVHNTIDTDAGILRKGAISAKKGERILIPINMRDGSLLCVGKGNEDWNCSAPHGAGRVLSRAAARQKLSLDEYKRAMQGIYTTSVGMHTIDESPMAYKDAREILRNIRPTCSVVSHLTPIYNFKAGT